MPVVRSAAVVVAILAVPAALAARHAQVHAREKTRYSLASPHDLVNHGATRRGAGVAGVPDGAHGSTPAAVAVRLHLQRGEGSRTPLDYRVAGVTDTTAPDGAIDSTVVVERRGERVLPVDIRVTFDDGSNVVETWDGGERRHAFSYRRAARVQTVEVDPDRVLRFESNRTNDTWTRRPNGARAAWKWTLHWLTWMEQVLVTYAAFA
jgi:hypothetical protein